MPAEYCTRCKTIRTMNVASSRIQVLLRGGKASEITTRTYYCRYCGSFLFSDERTMQPLADRARKKLPASTDKRTTAKSSRNLV